MGNDIYPVLPPYWRGIECIRIHVPRVAHVHSACSILESEDWNEFEKKRGARASTEQEGTVTFCKTWLLSTSQGCKALVLLRPEKNGWTEYGQSLDYTLALTQFDVWGIAYVLEAIDNTSIITADEIIIWIIIIHHHPQRQFEAGV